MNTADDNFQIRRLDQRGHVYQTQANDIYVDLLPRLAVAADGKSYEAVSNAHRTSGNGSDGWTRTTYDQLNRPIRIDHFDGSSLPYPWGTANVPTSFSTISYDGADTAFTDEAGQVRKQTLDAFDRVIQVQEDPGGKNYTVSIPATGHSRTFTTR